MSPLRRERPAPASRARRDIPLLAALAALAVTACGEDEIAEFQRVALGDSVATAYWGPDPVARPSADIVDAGRRDTSWWSAPTVDTVLRTDTLLSLPNDEGVFRPPRDSYRIPETWNDLNKLAAEDTLRLADPAVDAPAPDTDIEAAERADAAGALVIPVNPFAAMNLPLGGAVEGPSVMYAQILLDRSAFSPGAIDGRWGSNTERAVFWFQRERGIAPTGQVDSLTLASLYVTAGSPDGLLTRYVVTSEDLAEPFEPLPDDVYAQDSLACLCYESAAERLSERTHASEEVLAELNPGVDLDGLAAGDTIVLPGAGEIAPAPTGRPETGADIAQLVVSDRGRYVHALDASGTLLYHFPATVGAEYRPLPSRTLEVVSITHDPEFWYQPSLLANVSDTLPDTRLPPGPNSLVGVVWIKLSQEHYGIHGTNDPTTIGHTHSSGCIRLTNWDAAFLADRIRPGVSVRFVDFGS